MRANSAKRAEKRALEGNRYMPAWRLLYVDGDREARLLMQDLLSAHHLDAAATAEEVRALRRQHRSYDIYIIGAGGPDSDGIALCAWLHRIDPRTPIVFCSSNGSARYEQAAIAAGALRFHLKPVDPQQLFGTLNLLLKLSEFETARARSAQHAALTRAAGADRPAAAREPADERTRGRELRVRAYRAFRRAGGNRANFERTWPETLRELEEQRRK
jgi:DNA-binding NtrC family response regulator